MPDDEKVMIPPQNVAELGIHLDYMRRDIRGVQKSIEDLSKHFITSDEFLPVKELGEATARELGLVSKWKENLNGKMAVGGVFVAIFSSIASALLVSYFGG